MARRGLLRVPCAGAAGAWRVARACVGLVSGSSVIRGLPGSARARVAGSRLVHFLLHWSQV